MTYPCKLIELNLRRNNIKTDRHFIFASNDMAEFAGLFKPDFVLFNFQYSAYKIPGTLILYIEILVKQFLDYNAQEIRIIGSKDSWCHISAIPNISFWESNNQNHHEAGFQEIK